MYPRENFENSVWDCIDAWGVVFVERSENFGNFAGRNWNEVSVCWGKCGSLFRRDLMTFRQRLGLDSTSAIYFLKHPCHELFEKLSQVHARVCWDEGEELVLAEERELVSFVYVFSVRSSFWLGNGSRERSWVCFVWPGRWCYRVVFLQWSFVWVLPPHRQCQRLIEFLCI